MYNVTSGTQITIHYKQQAGTVKFCETPWALGHFTIISKSLFQCPMNCDYAEEKDRTTEEGREDEVEAEGDSICQGENVGG